MLGVLAVDDEEPALAELLFLVRADPRVRSAEWVLEAAEGGAHAAEAGRGAKEIAARVPSQEWVPPPGGRGR